MPHARCRLPVLIIFLVGWITSGCAGTDVADRRDRPNVLLIAVDDLRPELGAYGKAHVHTPALDRLADEGTIFRRAYANVPVCGASRASLLTGLRPTRGRFRDYDTWVRDEAPDVAPLPEHFKTHGYTAVGLGKVFHHADDAPESWSEPVWHPDADPATANTSPRDYHLARNQTLDARAEHRGPPYEAAAVSDSAYYDGKIAVRAARELERLARAGEPFFLAVGFLKPHLPFNAPATYWDLYPSDSIQLADERDLPKGAPQEAWHSWGELRTYESVPSAPEPLPDTLARSLIHSYYAATSYADAMIGLVLDELDRLGLAENTIVVLWGDHGWSLGEHGLWCKHSPFHNAVHAPLIVRAPGFEAGQEVGALTEFVDVYPSLTELAGLPRPDHVAGESFVPLLRDPSSAGKDAVFPRWQNSESIRTNRYLYTEWYDEAGNTEARMLYDHGNDPEETVNLAEEAAFADEVAQLSERLHAHVQAVE